MKTLPNVTLRWRSSMTSVRIQKISELAPKVARTPPAERQEVGRREQEGAGRQRLRPRPGGRARRRTRPTEREQDRGAAGDPEDAAPADDGRQHRSQHQAAGPAQRHADVVDAQRAPALFGRRVGAEQRVGRRPVGAFADARPARERTAASGTTVDSAEPMVAIDQTRMPGEDHLARADAVGDRPGDQRGDGEHEQVRPGQAARAWSWRGGTPRRCAASSRRRPAGRGS